MKKLAIYTLYKDNRNYGGLLQAFALQKVISGLGYTCQVITYVPNRIKYIINRLFHVGIKKSLRIIFMKIAERRQKRDELYRTNIWKRNALFRKFEEDIPHTCTYNEKTIQKCGVEYDAFICGSDQIWNPALWCGASFLNFVPEGKLKIAYAASIGKTELTKIEKKYMKRMISNLDYIAVREETAKDLLEKITEKNVEVVIDPTLLLSKNDWMKNMKKPEGCPERYAFLFSLGKDEQRKKQIYQYCREQKITLVVIPHLQNGYKEEDVKYSDIQLYEVGPFEWIYLIANAEIVFTDSFHGTAFSINLNKEFLCFGETKDKTRIGRLENLLNLLDIENRILGSVEEMLLPREEINYKKVNEKLEFLRGKSMFYLKNAIGDLEIR